MRIALGSIHPRPLSGQIEGLVGLAQALEEQGHSVTLVSPFESSALLGPARSRLDSTHHGIYLDQPSRITSVLARLARVAPQVDVIQLNLPTPAFAILADLLQLLAPVPVIAGYEAHLVSVRELMRRDRLWAAPEFYLFRLLVNNALVARVSLRRTHGHVVNSRCQKDELVRLGVPEDGVHVLPPVLPRDKLVRGSGEMRKRFPPGRIITYIGHYNHIKGVDVLLDAFRHLAPQHPDWHLVLAWSGVGSSRAVKERLNDPVLCDRVIMLNQVDVPELLAASDLAVLPYRMTIGQAAFPAVLVEAMAACVPVVTSDLPLLRELTENGRTAMLVPPEDAGALAGGIECALSTPALVAQMRREQERRVQQFTPEFVAREYERLYQSTAQQGRVLRAARDREGI